MNAHKTVIESLTNSKTYQEYERAFNDATGLPLNLVPVESWQLPHHGRRKENPFCALMSQKSRSCAACLQTQQQLAEAAIQQPASVTCQAGLCDMAVAVRMGDQLVGYLQTGQVFRKRPAAAQFDRMAKLVSEWGLEVDLATLREAYEGTRVVGAKEHDAILKLLSIFAMHLSMLSNQVMVQQQNAEPPVITRAKQYIQDNYSEDLSLGQVAKAVHTSVFYFCKIFRRVTGLHFTDYVSRVRIEKAKNLLLNPNLRISEIAYDVGFQSLTHFNRCFKRIVGLAPTTYRDRLSAT